jgi:protein involved in polysaccharide export with SLBB domain
MKTNKAFFVVYLLLLVLGFSVYAQDYEIVTTSQASNTEASLSASDSEGSKNIMLARSSADYQVTPGDVYTLAYVAGSRAVSYVIAVDSSYRIRVSNLGIVNGAGKTFLQLKSEVEAIVANNYPLSGVQMVLAQPAVFRVFVTGEVQSSREIPAWGLTRLSSLAGDNLTSYASIRDISIKSSNGQIKTYDLFKAQRLGALDQDPYLRPGDVITFNRINRKVAISGAVERPGTYQLLENENLKELIEVYANGFAVTADMSNMELLRFTNSQDDSGDKYFLSETDITNNYSLENADSVSVPSLLSLQSMMFVEGAVAQPRSVESQADVNVTNRLKIQFAYGETYSSLIRAHANWFTNVSDTQNAYVLRNGEKIYIDLDQLLYYSTSSYENFLVEEGDVLIVPFRQYFVTVAGSVINPGRYPYIPDRNWEYYIGLAGGFLPERNARQVITIRNSSGNELSKTSQIEPETTITAETNEFIYYFQQYAPVVTTVASILTTIVSLILMTQ